MIVLLLFALFGVCVIRRQGPAQLVVRCGWHLRAAWLWLDLVAKRIGELRGRYGECLNQARWGG